MENKIKKYQKKELMMRNIAIDDNMSFLEAQDLINQLQRQEQSDKKNKTSKTNEVTSWEKTSGTVVEIEHYANRGVQVNDKIYYISMQEPHLEKIKTGSKVECLIGHPGKHRPVAKELKLVA